MKCFTMVISYCNECVYARPGRNIGNEEFFRCEALQRKIVTKYDSRVYTPVEIPSDCPLEDVKK